MSSEDASPKRIVIGKTKAGYEGTCRPRWSGRVREAVSVGSRDATTFEAESNSPCSTTT